MEKHKLSRRSDLKIGSYLDCMASGNNTGDSNCTQANIPLLCHVHCSEKSHDNDESRNSTSIECILTHNKDDNESECRLLKNTSCFLFNVQHEQIPTENNTQTAFNCSMKQEVHSNRNYNESDCKCNGTLYSASCVDLNALYQNYTMTCNFKNDTTNAENVCHNFFNEIAENTSVSPVLSTTNLADLSSTHMYITPTPNGEYNAHSTSGQSLDFFLLGLIPILIIIGGLFYFINKRETEYYKKLSRKFKVQYRNEPEVEEEIMISHAENSHNSDEE